MKRFFNMLKLEGPTLLSDKIKLTKQQYLTAYREKFQSKILNCTRQTATADHVCLRGHDCRKKIQTSIWLRLHSHKNGLYIKAECNCAKGNLTYECGKRFCSLNKSNCDYHLEKLSASVNSSIEQNIHSCENDFLINPYSIGNFV